MLHNFHFPSCSADCKPLFLLLLLPSKSSPPPNDVIKFQMRRLVTRARTNLIPSAPSSKQNVISFSTMDNQTQNQAEIKEKKEKVHLQYNHTDSRNFARWNSRECYEFMYNRPWQNVVDFYSSLVNGKFNSLSSALSLANQWILSGECNDNAVVEGCEMGGGRKESRTGRWERVTFKILLSYDGSSFDGWQKQPGLNTVQVTLERSVGRFIDERKAQKLKDHNLPLEGNIAVAGRTDKGVTALNQVCSFYTWRKDVQARDVENAINEVAPGKLRVISVLKVSRDFHPNFSATWRRYLYIFPLNDGSEELCSDLVVEDKNHGCREQHHIWVHGSDAHLEENGGGYSDDDSFESESWKKPQSFSIQKLNQLLFQLQGKSLSYRMFARDTKASRSAGPPTECFIHHVRATEAKVPCDNQVPGEGKKKTFKAVCIELVANRFLRRMVRVLVATSIREAAAGADSDALLKLMDATCRRATAPPAPPDGLCLVDVGYSEFNPKNCLIP